MTGCREGSRGGLRGRRGPVDLGAVGLGRGSGRTQSSPGGGSARLVTQRPSRERGTGGSEVRQGNASRALKASKDIIEEGEETGCAQRNGGVGGREQRRFGGVARDTLIEEARRSTTLEIRYLTVVASDDGKWRDRKQNTARDKTSAQGEKHVMDGGERGGGVKTSGRGRLGSVGRDL